MNQNISMLDFINIASFVLQLQNNDELQQQTSNDEILKKLHDDVMLVLEDNRKICDKIIRQNEEILKILGGVKDAQSN